MKSVQAVGVMNEVGSSCNFGDLIAAVDRWGGWACVGALGFVEGGGGAEGERD